MTSAADLLGGEVVVLRLRARSYGRVTRNAVKLELQMELVGKGLDLGESEPAQHMEKDQPL